MVVVMVISVVCHEISCAQLQQVCVCTNQDERQDCETVLPILAVVEKIHRASEGREWVMVKVLVWEHGREGGSPSVLPDFETSAQNDVG